MRYLIWSNQHTRWWRPARQGYTPLIEEAGRYSLNEAEWLVSEATLGGELIRRREGQEYLDEVMVLAPECLD